MAMDSTNAPQMIEHLKKSVAFTPHDTKWIPCSARFVSCGISPSGKGTLCIYELSREKLKTNLECTSLRPHGLKCATFGASQLEDRVLAAGDYSGGLCIFDIERCSFSANKNKENIESPKPTEIFSVQAHKSIVNSIDGTGGSSIGHGAPELVTGGRDGCVKVWDPRVNYPVVCLESDSDSSPRDCWTVSFGDSHNDEERCVIAGYDNGDVKLFDLRTTSLRWETNCSNGVTSVEFDRKDIKMNKLVVTTLESKFRCYDMRTQHRTDGFAHLVEKAHRSTIWLGHHLPQNRDIFMTGGGNGGFNIYKYHYPMNRVGKHKQDGCPIGVTGSVELLNSRVISTQPIVSFDWSPDRAGLCCLGCLDQSIRSQSISFSADFLEENTMKFVASDGTVFTNRSDYRKYEMETNYTFRSKESMTLTKMPGSIQGQPFDIVNCKSCAIQILDNCDQVQIDDVSDCRIFIGASSESIFVRDCKNCTFTIACKQLRTRDCNNCIFYLYCKTEPIIETSFGMRFAPFNGAYPGHLEAMKAADLEPQNNLWYAVYDFNDEQKTCRNWSYLDPSEEANDWCPLGPFENCCPRVEIDPLVKSSQTVSNIAISNGAVTRTFVGRMHLPYSESLSDEMILDAHSAKESIKNNSADTAAPTSFLSEECEGDSEEQEDYLENVLISNVGILDRGFGLNHKCKSNADDDGNDSSRNNDKLESKKIYPRFQRSNAKDLKLMLTKLFQKQKYKNFPHYVKDLFGRILQKISKWFPCAIKYMPFIGNISTKTLRKEERNFRNEI